jgi:hypothetical protein
MKMRWLTEYSCTFRKARVRILTRKPYFLVYFLLFSLALPTNIRTVLKISLDCFLPLCLHVLISGWYNMMDGVIRKSTFYSCPRQGKWRWKREEFWEEFTSPFYLFFFLLFFILIYSPFFGLDSFFSFLFLYTIVRTPWMGDQPVAVPLPTHKTTQTNIHACSGIRWRTLPSTPFSNHISPYH